MTAIQKKNDYLVQKIPIGSHVALLYDDEEEKLDFLASFYKIGIENYERILHLSDTNSAEEFKTEMNNRGLNLNFSTEHRFDDATEIYCPNGEFSIDEMIDSLIEFIESSFTKEEFISARISGEMTWTLKKLKDSSQLFEYEANLNHIFKNLPFTGCCLYNLKKFSSETIMDILKTHPIVVYNGKNVQNPFYEEVESFLLNNMSHFL